jgi:hypothetical protein
MWLLRCRVFLAYWCAKEENIVRIREKKVWIAMVELSALADWWAREENIESVSWKDEVTQWKVWIGKSTIKLLTIYQNYFVWGPITYERVHRWERLKGESERKNGYKWHPKVPLSSLVTACGNSLQGQTPRWCCCSNYSSTVMNQCGSTCQFYVPGAPKKKGKRAHSSD